MIDHNKKPSKSYTPIIRYGDLKNLIRRQAKIAVYSEIEKKRDRWHPEKATRKDRDIDTMTTKYAVSWGQNQKSEHESQKGAQNKGRDLSKTFQVATVSEVVGKTTKRAWRYEAGKFVGLSVLDEDATLESALAEEAAAKDVEENLPEEAPIESEAVLAEQEVHSAAEDSEPAPEGYVDQDSPSSDLERFRAAFKTRQNSNRQRLLDAMVSAGPEGSSEDDLILAVYGEAHKLLRGPLKMVLKGLYASIEKDALPFEITKNKSGKERIYALLSK